MKLLVPIMVEAVRVSRSNEDWKKTGLVTPNYSELEYTILGGNLEREPFSSDSPLKKGVHLHFILPDALTKGMEKDGSFFYPDIPNRWLITRIQRDTRTLQAMSVKQTSWVIESDYIGTDNRTGVRIATLEDEKRRYKYLGRAYPSGKKEEGDGSYLEHLTVFGNGDPAFSAYYPSCQSVLGYYDDLEGVEAGKLMYLVLGWYEEKEKDPLWGATKENWSQYMEKLSWTAEIPGDSPVPQEILCHSAALCIDWKGQDFDYPSDMPEGEVELTMGNTSVEALSALIARKAADETDAALPLERFLNALQYDALEKYNEPDGISKVEDAIEQRFFAGEAWGSTWSVRGKEGGEAAGEHQELTAQATGLLYELNTLQYEEDRLSAALASQREKLYGIFYRYFRKYEDPPSIDHPPTREDMKEAFLHMEEKTRKTLEEREQAAKARASKQAELEAYLTRELSGFYLESKADRMCYRAADPVLLFSGDGVKRSYAFGADGRFAQDGSLFCRLQEQCVEGLCVDVEGTEALITEESLFSMLPVFPDPVEMDSTWRKLLFEGLLMDTASAGLLAPAACGIAGKPCTQERLADLEQKIKAQILSVYTPGNCLDGAVGQAGENAGYRGTLPSVIALNYTDGEWNSLYLEWEGCFYPTKTDRQQDNSMDGWVFDGIDYQYEEELPVSAGPAFYRGRTVLTPHPQLVLADVLERQASNYKENPEIYEKLKKLQKALGDLNILAQSMGGLTDLFTGRKYGLQFPVMITSQDLMQDETAVHMVKSLRESGEPEGYTPAGEEGFFPIRAGFWKISRMRILSTFGFSQMIFTDKNRLWTSETMDAGGRMDNGAMLSPRISQPAYLRYEWETVLEQDGSPVCGYLIPSYVNRGLMLYDVDGTMRGSLRLHYEKNGKTKAVWAAAPLSGQSSFEDTYFSNEYLKEMARSVLQVSQQKEGAFQELLDFLDQRQSNICVEGNSHGEELSVLWGRPLVLARASVGLHVKGELCYRQESDDMEGYESDGFEKVKFPVYLGDAARTGDGLAGWYLEDGTQTFAKLYAPEGVKPLTEKTPGYVEYEKSLQLSLEEGEDAHIWALMEPEGVLTLRSGILPVQEEMLPALCCKKALEEMYLTIETYPVVSPQESLAVLCPEAKSGVWSFVCPDKDASYTEYENLSSEANVFGRERQTLMDGYLVKKKKV